MWLVPWHLQLRWLAKTKFCPWANMQIPHGESDFTKYNIFLDQHSCWSWNNIPINQSELRDNFSGNICFRLMIRVRCFYTLVNQLFHTDFRNKLWVGLGLGVGIGLSLYFWTVMLIQDQQKMLIQEHVLLRKITVTDQIRHSRVTDSKRQLSSSIADLLKAGHVVSD